jgi:hypothetical protein
MRAVIILFGLAAILIAAATWVVLNNDLATAEISITLILIMGVLTLLAALGGLAALLRQWGLIDRREALALPPGSIRAVIALGLVLIFAMVSVFLIGQANVATADVTGLTAEQVADLPADRLVASVALDTDPETFRATLQVPDGSREELSQQLMTLLGTLVTAVVAFYFGAAVGSAGGLGNSAEGGPGPRAPLDPETQAAVMSATAAAHSATAAAHAAEAEALETEAEATSLGSSSTSSDPP